MCELSLIVLAAMGLVEAEVQQVPAGILDMRVLPDMSQWVPMEEVASSALKSA